MQMTQKLASKNIIGDNPAGDLETTFGGPRDTGTIRSLRNALPLAWPNRLLTKLAAKLSASLCA